MEENPEEFDSPTPKELVFQDVLKLVRDFMARPWSLSLPSSGGGRLWLLAAEGGSAPLDPHVLLWHPVRHDGLHEHGAEGAALPGHCHLQRL